MVLEVHARRFEDDAAKRAAEPTYVTTPARMTISEDSEVVITAKNGVVTITVDGEPQGMNILLYEWDYTAVAITYKEGV